MHMSQFFEELKRRNVFRVGIAYVVATWLLLQVTDILVSMLDLPDWAARLVLLLLAVGFIPSIILAWAYELTPQGLRREKDLDRSASVTKPSGRKLDFIIIGLLSVALVYFVYESRVRDVQAPDEVAAGIASPIRSIAVLPFINIGNVAENEYLSDGLAETLLNMLAQIEELQVAARTSAFKFKGTNEDVRLIGEQLGVGSVLEGSVQRSGDTIRITAQLIDVENGFHLWSENYERTQDDIFAVQDDIAASVVKALQLELFGRPQDRTGQDPAAYDALLRIREALRSRSTERVVAAIDAAEALVEAYPNYVDAYATLSEAYTIYSQTGARIPEDLAEQAIDAARKATELDPESPVGYVALGKVLVDRLRFIEASPVLDRALELDPGNAAALVAKSVVLQSEGLVRDALLLAEQASTLDPLNAETTAQLAQSYAFLGRSDEAISALNGGLMLEPGSLLLTFNLARQLKEFGRLTEAVEVWNAFLERESGDLDAWQRLFYLYFDLGDLDAAEAALEQGEALSESRLADERALLCVKTRDTACWYAATEIMVETRRKFFAQIWESRMFMDQGHIDEAIAVLLPWIEYFDATNDFYGYDEVRLNLAALYHMAGSLDLRDEILDLEVTRLEQTIEDGMHFWEPYYFLGLAAALRGDVANAVGYLEAAYERGFRRLWWFTHDYAWGPISETNEFTQFVRKVEAANAVMLEEVRAAQDVDER